MHLKTIFDGFDVEIDWLLTQRCNYTCSYCGTYDNSQEFLFRPLEEYKKAFVFLKSYLGNLKARITFLGGEPTLYKQWVELANILDELNYKVKISTNLSVPVDKYIDKLKPSLGKFIIASFHPEFGESDVFIDNVRKLDKDNFLLAVSVMGLPAKWDIVEYTYSKIKDIANVELIFEEESDGVQLANKYIEYSEEQMKLIEQSNVIQEDYALMIDDKKSNIRKLKFNHGVNFKGWKCKVGQKKMHIMPNGDVFPSACLLNYPKAKMGNIYTNNLVKPKNPITCPFKMCPCGSDIRIEKWAQV